MMRHDAVPVEVDYGRSMSNFTTDAALTRDVRAIFAGTFASNAGSGSVNVA